MTTAPDRAPLLRRLFDAAVAAADPMISVPANMPEPPRGGRLIVIGAGKASARMAEAFESAWDGPLEGFVLTRYGYARPCARIEIAEGSHPTPDAAGVAATRRIIEIAESAGEGDLVVALISGGGSSLLCAPADGLTLADKIAVNAALLASGAPIGEMNVVRKHLSAVKGGRLAAAVHPARLLTLLISDVPGDDPADIASGPTVAETSTPADARAIVARRKVALPPAAAEALSRENGCAPPGDPRLALAETRIVAAPRASLDAAAEIAAAEGIEVTQLGDAIEGESREIGAEHAALALATRVGMRPGDRPRLLLSGGETTVTVRGGGRGGRNVEYLLALAIGLDGARGISALACDTDGVDGREEVAGAVIAPDSLARLRAAGRDPARDLDENDAHSAFEATGDQVITGPTLTNVNDFRAILIEPPAA